MGTVDKKAVTVIIQTGHIFVIAILSGFSYAAANSWVKFIAWFIDQFYTTSSTGIRLLVTALVTTAVAAVISQLIRLLQWMDEDPLFSD